VESEPVATTEPVRQTVQVTVDGPTEASAQVIIEVAPTANTGGEITGTAKWASLLAGVFALVAVGLLMIRRKVISH
jgi:hypothetical protein